MIYVQLGVRSTTAFYFLSEQKTGLLHNNKSGYQINQKPCARLGAKIRSVNFILLERRIQPAAFPNRFWTWDQIVWICHKILEKT